LATVDPEESLQEVWQEAQGTGRYVEQEKWRDEEEEDVDAELAEEGGYSNSDGQSDNDAERDGHR
jgi:hypothetical protein